MSAIIKQISMALILMIGITMVMSATMQAQPKRMSVEEQIKVLNKKLKLNADQTSKITVILEDQREEITTAMSEHRGDRDAMRAAMQEMMKKSNTQIKAVLTEEQTVKYDELLKERREQIEKRMQKSDNP